MTMTMPRKSKTEYYLDIAQEVAKRSPCARRKFGAIIVKDDRIVSTGYNGAARGAMNCGMDIPCLKDLSNEAHQVSYANCSAVHAEDNAVTSAGWDNCKDAVMYIAEAQNRSSSDPCFGCRRKILNAQLKGVYGYDENHKIIYVTKEELLQKELDWQNEKLDQFQTKELEEKLMQ